MKTRPLFAAIVAVLAFDFAAYADPPASPSADESARPAAPSAAPGKAAPRTKTDPKGKTGVSPYTQKLNKGSSAYLARDYAGAVAAYREAIASEPDAPLGYYLLGEAQLAAGNLTEAESSYQTGLAKADGTESVKAKLLFVLAELRERQGKWDDAKKAWNDYAQFVSAHEQAAGYPSTATARTKAIEQHVELTKKSDAVKARIDQRNRETGASSPPSR